MYVFIVGHLQPSHVSRPLVNRAELPTVRPHVSASSESQTEPLIQVKSLFKWTSAGAQSNWLLRLSFVTLAQCDAQFSAVTPLEFMLRKTELSKGSGCRALLETQPSACSCHQSEATLTGVFLCRSCQINSLRLHVAMMVC